MHTYFRRDLAVAGTVQTISRSDRCLVLTRSANGLPIGGYRFEIGEQLDALALAIRGALTSASQITRIVAELPWSRGRSILIAYRSGTVIVKTRQPSGKFILVVTVGDEELRWLNRAVSDLQRFSFRNFAEQRSKRARIRNRSSHVQKTRNDTHRTSSDSR